MNQIRTLARRELKAYFQSPVGLIFLAAFLVATLIFFFWVGTFFRRDLADVRPLFDWLPLLLIFLVGALTMRLWSEERRSGTLEVLLTLPVHTSRLVLGKFFAGLGLVLIALVLTLGIPITVSMMGELDWGPVFGGYLAAVLLASTYLAIGLCFSAATDNMIVSLLLTWVACFLIYLPGSETVVSTFGLPWSEVLRAVGTGSRFESIQRGVLDLRDLVYYGSLTAGFLFLNVVILKAKGWSDGASTRSKRTASRVAVLLVLVNVVLFDVILAPVGWARMDLTERNEYSISGVTKKLLRGLDAPLVIRGYFSDKTHPLLAPLVPRIRDMIREYGVVGGGKVVAEFVDPRKDEATEKEANETFGIKSVPFQFADRHEAAVVNSYFNILVKYGDKFEVLNFDDLIEVKVTGMNNIEVKLRNLEYDLTRTIKKVVYGFQPLETLFARSADKLTLVAYITKKTLPKTFATLPATIEEVGQELKKRSGGKFELELIDPSGNDKLQRELYRQYGFKPMAVSLFSEESFYLHLLVKMGRKVERVMPTPQMNRADLLKAVESAMKRLAPGFLKVVGLLVPKEAPPQQPNPMMRRPPPRSRYQMLTTKLSESYDTRDVDLKDGRVPGDVDVLVVVAGEKLDDKQKFAIDQFLMRGGPVVVADGEYQLDPMGFGTLKVKKTESGVEDLLSSWGVKLQRRLVLDPQNEAFPVPVERNLGGLTVREIQLIKYPFWVDVRPDSMAEGNPVVAGLPSATMQWASPLELTEAASKRATVLLRSSKGSWVQDGAEVQPNFAKHPQTGFGVEGKVESRILAVSVVGPFDSHFADKPSPLFGADQAPGDKAKKDNKQAEGRTIKKSPKESRLAVVGSVNFVNDIVLSLSRQTGSDRFTNNLQLMQNLIDWSVADVDLLTIRSRGTYARTLKPMNDGQRTTWEVVNYGVVLAALLLLVLVTVVRRRGVRPMTLVKAPASGSPKEV